MQPGAPTLTSSPFDAGPVRVAREPNISAGHDRPVGLGRFACRVIVGREMTAGTEHCARAFVRCKSVSLCFRHQRAKARASCRFRHSSSAPPWPSMPGRTYRPAHGSARRQAALDPSRPIAIMALNISSPSDRDTDMSVGGHKAMARSVQVFYDRSKPQMEGDDDAICESPANGVPDRPNAAGHGDGSDFECGLPVAVAQGLG